MAVLKRVFDPRPWITLANEYYRHRKIRGLSDAAFRVHVTLLLIANEERTDGRIVKTDLFTRGPKVAKELIDAGLVLHGDGEYALHDYLEHQKSRQEIADLSADLAKRGQSGGIKSAHIRHHVAKGVLNERCALCQQHGLNTDLP